MLVSILIGAAIFGYALWTILQYIRKSKEGQCAGCSRETEGCGGCAQSAGERKLSSGVLPKRHKFFPERRH